MSRPLTQVMRSSLDAAGALLCASMLVIPNCAGAQHLPVDPPPTRLQNDLAKKDRGVKGVASDSRRAGLDNGKTRDDAVVNVDTPPPPLPVDPKPRDLRNSSRTKF